MAIGYIVDIVASVTVIVEERTMMNQRPSLHALDAINCPSELKLASRTEAEHVHQRHTQDVYAQSCAITAWQQLYDQVRPGHFRGELTELLFDGVQFCHE